MFIIRYLLLGIYNFIVFKTTKPPNYMDIIMMTMANTYTALM